MTHAHRMNWCLFLLAISSAAWAAPPTYRVTELEGFVPTAINNRGQIVGNAADGGVLYSDGTITHLGAGVNARDLNDMGHVTGSSSAGAFVWRDGTLTRIGGGIGQSINNQGWVAGNWYVTALVPGSSEVEVLERAFIYDGNATHDALEFYDPGSPYSPGGMWAYHTGAYEIDESGHVAGYVSGFNGEIATVFAPGGMRDVSPSRQSIHYRATTLNDHGQAAGYGDQGDAFFYDGTASGALPTASFLTAEPVALDQNGRTLINYAVDINFYYSPLLFEGGVAYDISDHLGLSGSEVFMVQAFDMNDAGQIIAAGAPRSEEIPNGGGWEGSSSMRYYLLTPVPEPSSYALMAAGLMLLASRVYQRRARQQAK